MEEVLHIIDQYVNGKYAGKWNFPKLKHSADYELTEEVDTTGMFIEVEEDDTERE